MGAGRQRARSAGARRSGVLPAVAATIAASKGRRPRSAFCDV